MSRPNWLPDWLPSWRYPIPRSFLPTEEQLAEEEGIQKRVAKAIVDRQKLRDEGTEIEVDQ